MDKNVLLVRRVANNTTEGYCISHLFINGKYFCDVLEDVDRGLDSKMSIQEIANIKIKNQTAIPTGEYNLILNQVSPRFKNTSWAKKFGGIVPILDNVPGYEGVLIHPGNTKDNTSGCLLVGWNKIKGQVIKSQDAWKTLMNNYLMKYKQPWIVKIERQYKK